MNTKFEPKSDVPKQPTVPPMPKVKPPRGRDISDCLDCRHFECDSEEYPCSDCKHTFNAKSENEHFSPINEKLDDINHPDRYAGGRYECIDVMVDVFGVQAVKDFCKLNAFKYLWREEKKGGIEDAKKAIWYLEKFIELGEKMTLNEAIEMTENLARYVRKFPNILLSIGEIERIIGINRTGV